MSDKPEAEFTQLQTRVVNLEELFTHLQATVQTLSDELFRQGRQLDRLERETRGLRTQVDQASAQLAEQRRPEDEKPPHY